MVFSSYKFIFLFFPLVFLGYHIFRGMCNATVVKAFLLVASLVFYGVGQPDYIVLFIVSLGINYGLCVVIAKTQKKALRITAMTVAALWNVGLLLYFKYTNFFLETANALFGSQFPCYKIILPIGISFFTFQILFYTVDLFRGNTELVPVLDYTLFICFFPQLIVGPVVRHSELLPQFKGDNLLNYDPANIYRGITLFSVGCAKKILIANPLIDFATAFYNGNLNSFTTFHTWAAILAYALAYYFDFSGYIDMARGLGCFFGIKLPINFDSPYQAVDFADFWRRWNVTVSRFFNDTVFVNIFHFGDRLPKMLLATMATFVVSGLWHGAAWHFVLWGAVNGVLVCLSNIATLKKIKVPKGLGIAITFFVCTLVRVLFDANDINQAIAVYVKLFDFKSLFTGFIDGAAVLFKTNAPVFLLLPIGTVISIFFPNSNYLSELNESKPVYAVISACCLVFSLLCMSEVSTFLYFNF